tara:strand:- start:1419 stop:2720 length:1302 start_codon:yes stop_codon:yes gene_type:complete
MLKNKHIFLKKKILIYGLGKSGLSTYHYLKKNNFLYLFDDQKNLIKNSDIKKKLITFSDIIRKEFDHIIVSPGIDIKTCKLNKYLIQNLDKIYTDLDVFYSFHSDKKNIAVTGTNGKSTTVKIIYDILKDQKFDARLVGNIGNPILLEKRIKKKTIFVVEASSYQLEYSKLFKAHFAVILNISPDHLERHGNLRNYIKSKFKIIKNQSNKDVAFLNTKNRYIKKGIKENKVFSNIIRIDKNISTSVLNKINNPYFFTEGNKENLSTVIEVLKKFNIKKNKIFKFLKNFKGLKYRQQIIYKSKKLTIINDSKATSYSSSISILKSLSNVFWIVGGIPKKGDKFLLPKKYCKTFQVYIFGKNQKLFLKQLKNKMYHQVFPKLSHLIKKISYDIKKEKNKKHKTILFSPAAASFDSFKNFEDRGKKFNQLIKNLKK